MSKIIGLVAAASLIGAAVGWVAAPGNPNAAGGTYGPKGHAKNCRAIIQSQIDLYRSGQSSVDQMLMDIERYCGIDGNQWRE